MSVPVFHLPAWHNGRLRPRRVRKHSRGMANLDKRSTWLRLAPPVLLLTASCQRAPTLDGECAGSTYEAARAVDAGPCREIGCERVPNRFGVCRFHAGSSQRPCQHVGCDEMVKAARFCTAHRKAHMVSIGNLCAVTTCVNPVSAKGMCDAHYGRLKKYGLTADAFDALLAKQGGGCAVCGITESESPSALVVDHDHSCCPERTTCGACVRGVLCKSCNVGLGNLKDDPALLIAAAAYLSR